MREELTLRSKDEEITCDGIARVELVSHREFLLARSGSVTDTHKQDAKHLIKRKQEMLGKRSYACNIRNENCTLQRCARHGRISDGSINNRWNASRTGPPINYGARWYCVRNDENLLPKCVIWNWPVWELDDWSRAKCWKLRKIFLFH